LNGVLLHVSIIFGVFITLLIIMFLVRVMLVFLIINGI